MAKRGGRQQSHQPITMDDGIEGESIAPALQQVGHIDARVAFGGFACPSQQSLLQLVLLEHRVSWLCVCVCVCVDIGNKETTKLVCNPNQTCNYSNQSRLLFIDRKGGLRWQSITTTTTTTTTLTWFARNHPPKTMLTSKSLPPSPSCVHLF